MSKLCIEGLDLRTGEMIPDSNALGDDSYDGSSKTRIEIPFPFLDVPVDCTFVHVDQVYRARIQQIKH